jgi:uncharacterized OB-fold protein
MIVNAPGSNNAKTVVGVAAVIGLCAISFFDGEAKKNGHGAFDVDKPEDVQTGMDVAAKIRIENNTKRIIDAAGKKQ